MRTKKIGTHPPAPADAKVKEWLDRAELLVRERDGAAYDAGDVYTVALMIEREENAAVGRILGAGLGKIALDVLELARAALERFSKGKV